MLCSCMLYFSATRSLFSLSPLVDIIVLHVSSIPSTVVKSYPIRVHMLKMFFLVLFGSSILRANVPAHTFACSTWFGVPVRP